MRMRDSTAYRQLRELEMAEKALFGGVVSTFTAIPWEGWTDSDKEYIQGNLQKAINLGGLTKNAQRAATAMIETLYMEDSDADEVSRVLLPQIGEILCEGGDKLSTVSITVQKPTVSLISIPSV